MGKQKPTGEAKATKPKKTVKSADVKPAETTLPSGTILSGSKPVERPKIGDTLNGGIITDITPAKKTTGLTYDEAMAACAIGECVKLPEWGGYWTGHIKTEKILVMTKDGELLDTPHHDKYKDRNDWEITDGETPKKFNWEEFEAYMLDKEPEETETEEEEEADRGIIITSTTDSFDANLEHIQAGKKMKLKEDKDHHFVFEAGRLKKYHTKSGSYIDSAPLYAFQDKDGWEVVK